MISLVIDYIKSYRRIVFRYVDVNGNVTEKWAYELDHTLASESVSLEIEGEPGHHSEYIFDMLHIPKNIMNIKCSYLKVNSITLSIISLDSLTIDNCIFVDGNLFYIGMVKHLRIYNTNAEYFELFYPDKILTIDVIDAGLKQLPTSISRCCYLKSHLNIPYSIASPSEKVKEWYWIFYNMAKKELVTQSQDIIERNQREFDDKSS